MATFRKILFSPCARHYHHVSQPVPRIVRQFNTRCITLNDFLTNNRYIRTACRLYTSGPGKDGPAATPGSTQPLGSILKQAEEEWKQEQKAKEEAKKKKGKSGFARAQKWAFIVTFGSLGLGGVFAVFDFGAPKTDEQGNRIPDEFDNSFIVWAYLQRTYKAFTEYRTLIVEPTAEKLLPDPLEPPYYQPPYTLVLEMKNILVHPEWTYGTGWRFKKRPGVDYFLSQVGPPLFEVVLYTQEQSMSGYSLVDKLDPNGYITYRLFRDATKYMNGYHVKDLSCLNRELSKVIIVDCDRNAFQLHPNNAVGLKPWEGNDDDRTLYDLAVFLRTIAISGVEDVRSVLEHYRLEEDPLEAFKRNQAMLQDELNRKEEEVKKPTSLLAGSFAKGLLGR